MPPSVEQRLAKLEAKRAELDQKIKRIKAEKSLELRKRQVRREELVGKAVYALVETGQWDESQLLSMMDTFLTRDVDRKLFSLNSASDVSEDEAGKTPAALDAALAVLVLDDDSDAVETKKPREKSKTRPEKSTAKPKAKSPLPESSSQDDLMAEFNL